jgi:hypothetical protein
MLIADYVAIGALIACMLVLCAGARAERTRNARRWRQCDGSGLDRKGLVLPKEVRMFWQWEPELYQARECDSRATMTARTHCSKDAFNGRHGKAAL